MTKNQSMVRVITCFLFLLLPSAQAFADTIGLDQGAQDRAPGPEGSD